MAAVDSVTDLTIFSIRAAAGVAREAVELDAGVGLDVTAAGALVVVVAATAAVGDATAATGVGSAVGVVVRAAKASAKPEQVGLLSGFVAHWSAP